jgi:hypothetical protein
MAAGLVMLAPLAAAPSHASERPPISVYTTFDADKCQHEASTEEEDYGSWSCPGHRGLRILLSAGDQRMYVTYGNWKGDDDIALSQTFPGFNDVYKGCVEWRIERTAKGKAHPFATILRWNVMTGDDLEGATGPVPATGRVLVVTRLGPGGVCHVGYVDARANPEANTLARQIADERARAFRCGKDKPVVFGKVSPNIEMPKSE